MRGHLVVPGGDDLGLVLLPDLVCGDDLRLGLRHLLHDCGLFGLPFGPGQLAIVVFGLQRGQPKDAFARLEGVRKF